jgi:integrase
MLQKTQRPVQFEITEQTRESIAAWIRRTGRRSEDFLFPSRLKGSDHLSTRQYARIVHKWVHEIGLDPAAYGTHTLRRTKASLIYRRTKNLRAVQLLLGHSKLESTVRYRHRGRRCARDGGTYRSVTPAGQRPLAKRSLTVKGCSMSAPERDASMRADV